MEGAIVTVRQENGKKKGIRKVIVAFGFAMVTLTFFSNTLLNLSLAEVTVEKSIAGGLSHEVTGTGTTQAAETSDLYVETNWPVASVAVKAGDTVEAGQELVTMKTTDAEDALQDNRARLRQKQLSLEKLQESYEEAFRTGDDKQLHGMARDMESLQLDIGILERQIASGERQLAAFSRIVSPVAGIVTEVNAVKGAPVQSGKAAVRIADMTKGQELKAVVEEAKVPYVQVGDKTEVIFASLNNAHIPAEVTEIRDAAQTQAQSGSSGSTGSTGSTGSKASESSGAKEVTLTLHDGRLKGGESGSFSIVKKTPTFRSVLPNDAIREDDNGTFVLIVKEKKGPLGTEYELQRASVQTGDSDDEKTSIENGITPLDQVVVSSSKSVTEGDRVLVRKD
ncbi:efflux RND transporter periplasmic adaptor subunit [Paenibacillus ferrarius]|uniref:efflux RND transporter periplasmic adaptor subunit n=1 Tax=Paenibacillus ferrarius TaxID=1469647 RepID=UPI003D28C5A2